MLLIVEYTNSIRTYEKGLCIVFRNTKEKHGGLSNMAGGFPIIIGNIKVRNTEALYQALKYPDHPDIQAEILSVASPIFAKKKSRKFKELQREDWEEVQFKVMKLCLEIKLRNNFETFSRVLLDTGDLPIVEFTHKDKVWGAIDTGDRYEGVNALGRLLRELRDKVKNKTATNYPTIPDVKNIKLLNVDLKEFYSNSQTSPPFYQNV